jgi:fructan beta-fructosidase
MLYVVSNLSRTFALMIALSGMLFSQAAAYDQPFRPQFHFSPREHWTNDPNGLVFFEGEYHIFYQYNPFGDTWGHMSWGHAVSPDLLHWKELPVALPEEKGVMIFTGSAVVDHTNSSGFCLHNKPCLIAVWTGHTSTLQTQNIAYSNDRGRTWTKYSGNPVLDLHLKDFRDPKVFWSAQAKQWVMLVALPAEHKVIFYGSPDFKQWKRLSEFGPAGMGTDMWECPELFELPVDGKAETRWVLKVGVNPHAVSGGSGEQYFVGRFDGERFQNDNPATTTLWTDYGKDCYCALTYSNLPKNNPPIMLGWMSNWQYADKTPTAPFRGQMTLPRRLSVKTTPDGLRLFQQPIDSLAKLRTAPRVLRETMDATGHQFEFTATMPLGTAQEIGWKLLAKDGTFTNIGYDKQRAILFVDRTHSGNVAFHKDFPARTEAPLTLTGNTLHLNVIVDRDSVEVFANNGQVALTNLVFAPADAENLEFYSKSGKAGTVSGNFWKLASAW